jgi:hypothetical protein
VILGNYHLDIVDANGGWQETGRRPLHGISDYFFGDFSFGGLDGRISPVLSTFVCAQREMLLNMRRQVTK